MICVWRAHIEGQAGAKELLAVSPGSRAHLCLGSMAAIACSTRSGSPALGQKHFCRLFFFCPREWPVPNLGDECTLKYLVIPMCSFASNVIGSHPAPLRATLLHFFSKNIFRTMFFCMRSQKGTFKRFPTKWYTLSLFQSA